MKTLHFDYYMQIDYSKEVSTCHFTIKCFPTDTQRQKIRGLSVELFPDVPYAKGEDSFHNQQIYGEDTIPHDTFHFRIKGDVEAGLEEWETKADENRISVFCYPHGLNAAGEQLRAYHDGLKPYDGRDAYERSLFLMHSLHRDFAYEKGCTTMKTTAEEAWRIGKGVCQDYAHILIALLQMDKIPARYVTGMLVGEGASHAWVEIEKDGKWYGIDPTNDAKAGDDYIRIGCGRDAADCLINRGIMHGGGSQIQTVQVCVQEVAEKTERS